MKIAIVSNEHNYKQQFESYEQIELALVFDKVKDDNNTSIQISALVVDGQNIPYTDLERVRDIFPDIPIFYKLNNVTNVISTKNIKRVCAAHKVIAINEHLTPEQVASEIVRLLTDQKGYASNRIISFFGTHSGAGVSTTVLNVGRGLSERIQGKVLVLSLNAWDPSDYFLEYRGEYLNDLKVDLKTKSLTESRLKEALFRYKDFYHLAGNRDIKLQRYFTNEEIAHLIDVAKEVFDVILIDGGTHFDTACASQAFISSELKFVITNQEDKGYRGYFPHVFQQLLEPIGASKSDFMLIVNKYQPNMSLISENDLEEELEMQKIAMIPDLEVLGPIAIRQKKLLYDLSEGKNAYRKSLESICNLIISEAKLPEKKLTSHDSNNKFFGFFKKKEGA
ncbi:ParA family protein [Metabacillus halosaccharovorans]|uniref:ParA family protein n=1 Tax=Metabacillus halosaccharovorans TaxID=930124 RepID=UPI001C1FC17F|nr:ParA family protein [Metabacillus halosaccharovorans]